MVSYNVPKNDTNASRFGTISVANQAGTTVAQFQIGQDAPLPNFDGEYKGTFMGFLTCPTPDGGVVTAPVNGTIDWIIADGEITNGGSGGIDSFGHVNISYPTPIGDLTFTGDAATGLGLWTLPLPPCPGGSGSGTWNATKQ